MRRKGASQRGATGVALTFSGKLSDELSDELSDRVAWFFGLIKALPRRNNPNDMKAMDRTAQAKPTDR